MRKLILGAAIAALAAAPAVVIEHHVAAEQTATAQQSDEQEYVVVYTEGASLDAARAAVEAAGATILSENADVGVATVVTTNANFTADAGPPENFSDFREVGIRPRSGPSHTRHEEPPRSGRGTPRSRDASGNRRKGK
jgi:hypothetical protein